MTYLDYNIKYQYSDLFTFSHKDYDGVYEYDGETGEPSKQDDRSGCGSSVEDCKEKIDELINP